MKKEESKNVRTTIVGGRPPAQGRATGDIPRGIEVLVKKAAVDPEFRELLLKDRAAAARAIGVDLTLGEAMMLKATPDKQLASIIANIQVPTELLDATSKERPTSETVEDAGYTVTRGIQPDFPPATKPTTKGIRPDLPERTKSNRDK